MIKVIHRYHDPKLIGIDKRCRRRIRIEQSCFHHQSIAIAELSSG